MANIGTVEPPTATRTTMTTPQRADKMMAIDTAHHILEVGRLDPYHDLASAMRALPSAQLTWLTTTVRQVVTAAEQEILRRTLESLDL